MSDTPRTDAVACYDASPLADKVEVVDADFARTLERELATLREKLKVAKEALESASCDPSAIGFDAQVALAKLEDKP